MKAEDIDMGFVASLPDHLRQRLVETCETLFGIPRRDFYQRFIEWDRENRQKGDRE